MTPSRPRVLVIDDGELYADVVARRLEGVDRVEPPGGLGRFGDGPSALGWLARHRASVDIVLLDMHFDLPPEQLLDLGAGASPRRTRRYQGIAILRALRRRHPDLPVVLLTAQADLALADLDEEAATWPLVYLLDGDDLDSLRIRLHAALRDARLGLHDGGVWWGHGDTMQQARRRLAVLARGRLPIVLEGETGTGKTWIAERFIHANSGRSGPFVAVDLSTVPPDLVPATLFGVVRGAYTGASQDRPGLFRAAHHGTLLIDEIQNAPPAVQRQLLTVLQDGRVRRLGASRSDEVDVKVIAASNASLSEAVRDGRFRTDLYMRLCPATRVVLPSLRERRGDVAELCARFVADAPQDDPGIAELLAEIGAARGLSARPSLRLRPRGRRARAATSLSVVELALPAAAWRGIEAHGWPGNVRELAMVARNLVTFTLVDAVEALRSGAPLSGGPLQIDPALVGSLLRGGRELLPDRAHDTPSSPPADGAFAVHLQAGHSLNAAARHIEAQVLEALFRRCDGDLDAMAEELVGDRSRGRAVRLRLNQLGLRLRDLRRS